jgi:hypothetical protein
MPHLAGFPSATSLAVARGSVWVFDDEHGTLFRLDTATNKVTKSISRVYASPPSIVAGDGVLRYLVSAGANYPPVVNLDVATGTRTPLARLAGAGSALAVSGGRAWVAVPRARNVTGYDLQSGAPDVTARTGRAPAALAVDSTSVWVANAGPPASVSRIDPTSGRVVATIPLAHRPAAIAVAGGAVWVAVDGT